MPWASRRCGARRWSELACKTWYWSVQPNLAASCGVLSVIQSRLMASSMYPAWHNAMAAI